MSKPLVVQHRRRRPAPADRFARLIRLLRWPVVIVAARIREESGSLGIGEGTLRGLGVTGGVITAAGIVMAATFSALTLIPAVAVAVAEVGVAVALGVLLDTLLVRTVLVPASLLTVGERTPQPAQRGGRCGHCPVAASIGVRPARRRLLTPGP
jgi:putative drug exporter of the RND superfamily